MTATYPQWIERISRSLERSERLCLGLMSGTSANGIDAAICRLKGTPETGTTEISLISAGVFPYPDDLRKLIQQRSGTLDTRAVSELHARIGDAFADAAQAALKAAQVPALDLDIVGSHGQTVYHHSRQPGALKTTLQLGDGDRLAARLGAPVFFDFRARDTALGGEGAPLTPYTDGVMYGARGGSGKAVLNLGGIANITFLADDRRCITGFDVGPANAPLDRIARRLTGGKQTCDEGGALALKGTVVPKLLEELQRTDAFIALSPPKSSGFEMYGDAFVDRTAALYGGPVDVHVLRTMVEFVAWSIADAATRFLPPGARPVSELIVAGGGTENPVVLRAIAERCQPYGIAVKRSEEVGIPSAAREAIAFAILAHDALLGCPTSLPAVTGAHQAAVLGKLCLPPLVRSGV